MFHVYVNRLDTTAFVTRYNPSTHPVLSLYFNRLKSRQFINSLNLFDVKLVVCDDPIAVILARIIFSKAKIVFFVLEMFESQRGAGVCNSIKNFLYKIFSKVAHQLCTTLIYPNQLRKRWYGRKKWYSRTASVFVLQNISSGQGGASDIFDGKCFKRGLPETKFDKVNLVYAGSLQDDRGVKLINLISELEIVNIYICSSDVLPSCLIKSNIIFLGYFHRDKLLSAYKCFDGAIVSYDNSPQNVRYAAPVKIWEYVEANLLVIGNDNYSLRREYKHLMDCCVTDKKSAADYFGKVIDFKRMKTLKKNSGNELVSHLRTRQLMEFDSIIDNLL